MGKIIVIQGATASGKSSLAVKLAAYHNVPVISADSRQFYKEMSIGTAVPTPLELSTAKHYFIQDRSVTEPLSAGGYEVEAVELINTLNEPYKEDPNKIIGVVVGGSGLFVDALLYGMDPLPSSSEVRAQLNEILESKGLDVLVEALRMADPAYYNIVDRSNPQRVIRALEVCRVSGMPYSNLRSGRASIREFGVEKYYIDLPREELYSRIDSRVDVMIEEGLVEEVRPLIPYENLTALQSVGYSELFEHFRGEISMERAVELIKQHSRNYAKRQITWLRRDKVTPRVSPVDFDITLGL